MSGLPGMGIRFKVTLIAVIGALVASVAVVAATAFATQSILEQAISDDLSDHLDKAQEAVEVGNFDLAVRFAGSDLMQVIGPKGDVLASSANAVGLAAIIADLDGEEGEYELTEAKLREQEDKAQERLGDGAEEPEAQMEAMRSQDGSVEDGGDGDEAARDSSKPSSGGKPSNPAAKRDDDDDDAADEAEAGGGGAAGGESDVDDDDDGTARAAGEAPVRENADFEDDYRDDGAYEDASDYGDDEDDDEVAVPAGDGRDDDDEDGGGASDDDDDDDDDRKGGKRRGVARPAFVPVERAFAASPSSGMPSDGAVVQEEGPYIDASSVLGSEGPYLVKQRKVDSPEGPVTLAAMTSLAPALVAAQTASQLLVVFMAALLLVVALSAWYLTGRTLRPVSVMRASADVISESDLSRRIMVPEGDKDLAPLAMTLNELLGRIEVLVDRQKRFISDASHELKSPVAATGIMLETMRSYPDAVDASQAVDDLANENDRMARIVDNMLVLARHDEGHTTVEPAPVDMLDVLLEEASIVSRSRSVSIDASAVQPVVCTTDREQLSHIVRNLLDNAARYAESTVKLSCGQFGDTVRITVSDDGPGIPEADREHVFERFVRLETEATRKKESTGLGLSVVKSAVERLGGTVRFVEPELGGATAVVELPSTAL